MKKTIKDRHNFLKSELAGLRKPKLTKDMVFYEDDILETEIRIDELENLYYKLFGEEL